ncbi:hypothetical protein ACVWXQ_000013 [Bradyrhizobium sp. S3.14.4]
MGKAGNGELAIAITVFSCVLPLSSSHRGIDTTAYYAKADVALLKQVAQP